MLATVPLHQYVAKLGRRRHLCEADRTALLALPIVQKSFAAQETIVCENGGRSTAFCIVNAGLASCFKLVEGSRRQIIGVAIPGDAIGLASVILGYAPAHAKAHVATETSWIAHDDLLTLCRERPSVAEAIWLDTAIDADIACEWAANIGQRHGAGRMSHLLLELYYRMQAAGLADNHCFEMPLTQQALADALGLSLVHCNKTLKSLSRAGAIRVDRRRVQLLEPDMLKNYSGFDPRYLHTGDA